MINYLTKNQVIKINKATIDKHGGNFAEPFNFLKESNLDYLLEAVKTEMFGEELYPKITDKAALYCFNIISNHIFSDGNKRTGLAASLQFLNLNHCDLSIKATNSILTEFILSIAEGKLSLEDCKAWFETNVVKM
ncbi:MAG: type II toxin-antitoxin system death-on-curing family toxin [Bacteroidota bacterium]